MLKHSELVDGMMIRYIGYNAPGLRFGFKSHLSIERGGKCMVKDMNGWPIQVYEDKWIAWDDTR